MGNAMDPEQFQALVLEYGAVHSRAKALAATAKELRTRKKELEDAILEYMQDHDLAECAWDHGRLVRKQKEHKESLKKEHIVGELSKLVSVEAIEDAIANMHNRRVTDVKDVLAVEPARAAAAEPI
jgi:hypothetical protein